jgi:hypothetical protein
MSAVSVSVSSELKAFFRFIGDAHCHDQSVDLDYALQKISEFNEKAEKPFNQAELLQDCHVVARKKKTLDTSGLSEIQQMRMQMDERKYQESVKSLKLSTFCVREEVKDLKEAYFMAAHFFISFFGSFLFGALSTNLFLAWSMEHSVFAGVACAVFILCVEAMLYIIREKKLRKKYL